MRGRLVQLVPPVSGRLVGCCEWARLKDGAPMAELQDTRPANLGTFPEGGSHSAMPAVQASPGLVCPVPGANSR